MKVGLNLYDVLTRITPGAVLVFPLTFTKDNIFVDFAGTTLTSSAVVGFIVLSLIVGEAIDLTREKFLTVPLTFRRFLYHETGREGFLSGIDQFRINRGWSIPKRRSVYSATDRELYYEITDRFGLGDDYEHVDDLYLLLLNDVEEGMSGRTDKLLRNYVFVVNMTLALLGYSVIAGIRGVVGGKIEALISALLLSIGLMAVAFLFLAFHLYGSVEVAFVDSLISDFFAVQTHRESSNDDS